MSELIDSNPLVTVYIPTYNRVELLKRAVESVRQQTYKNLEIIIVDDCSIDGTHSYLKEITEKDARIRFFLKEKNSGACMSRNIAIENAKGEFITGLDDDDYFLTNRIETFMENKSRLLKYYFLASRYFFIKVNNSELRKSKMEHLKPSCIKSTDLLSYQFIGNQIFTLTKRLKLHKFPEKLSNWQDLYMWYSMLIINNNKAYIIKSFTYVVDESHGYVRITNEKKEKVVGSYLRFVKDFNLSFHQSEILKNQLYTYKAMKKERKILFKAFYNSISLYTFFILVLNLLRK